MRARRAEALTGAAELLVVLAALGGIGLALRHAADALEATLGVSVAVAIAVMWVLRVLAHRREIDVVGSSATNYVAALRSFRARQLRFVHFAWAVLALELVFLAPWWAGGITAHRARLGDPIALVSLWLPLATMAGFAAWTARLRHAADAELRRLERLEQEMVEDHHQR
jgi:hypothetical protein